ncbi:MAG: hypothetical protein DRG82_00060 [Deltaproteobacteria bacterium]|nr:MAG: hypothetical protein DRG82_00060 [Deltaproteobacteria bacterium]
MEMKEKSLKGYGLILLANICFSIVYLVIKDVKPRMQFEQFLFYWFLCGSVYYLAPMVKADEIRMLKIPRHLIPVTIVMGVFEVTGTLLFFYVIRLMNPAVVSFYTNVSIVMTITMGILFLKERFAGLEALGGIILGIGIILMTYKAGETVFLGFLLIMLLSLLFSINTILMKVTLKDIHPIAFSTYRTFLLFAVATTVFLFRADKALPELPDLLEIALGAFLGPFAGVFLQVSGLQYLEASKASLVGATKPLMVLIGCIVWLGQIPGLTQSIGGGVALAGIELMLWGKFKLEKRKSHASEALPEERKAS